MTDYVKRLSSSLRDELAARRAARTAQLSLRKQLKSYTTPNQINDLLAVVDRHDGPEAQQMRRILLENLYQRAA